MMVSFFGLTGVQGVLPLHYTEHIIARAGARDFAMAEFFDLFNHRLISLFYRAWEKHSFPACYQLEAARKQPSRITEYLLTLVGLGTGGLQRQHLFPDQAALRYAGLLAQMPRSAVALTRVLSDFFNVEVEVVQFVGYWHAVEEDDRCNLDGRELRNQLGMGAMAGDAVWDPQAGIRVRLGPLPLVTFLAFLPNGSAAPVLQNWIRMFAGPEILASWQPVLAAREVPWCRIGDESAIGPRLGWTAWLKTGSFIKDADDALFECG
jgi:type VI secretion system protein ImpH